MLQSRARAGVGALHPLVTAATRVFKRLGVYVKEHAVGLAILGSALVLSTQFRLRELPFNPIVSAVVTVLAGVLGGYAASVIERVILAYWRSRRSPSTRGWDWFILAVYRALFGDTHHPPQHSPRRPDWIARAVFLIPREIREPWLGDLREDRMEMARNGAPRWWIEVCTMCQLLVLACQILRGIVAEAAGTLRRLG